MKTEVIDNYLPKDVFEDLQKYIICQYFPWFYQPYIGNDQDPKEHVILASTFYDNNSPRENWYWERLCLPILRTFKYKALLRIKANLYLNQTNGLMKERKCLMVAETIIINHLKEYLSRILFQIGKKVEYCLVLD